MWKRDRIHKEGKGHKGRSNTEKKMTSPLKIRRSHDIKNKTKKTSNQLECF